MFWYILSVVSVLFIVGGLFWSYNGGDIFPGILVITGSIALFISILTIPMSTVENKVAIQTFKDQKQYIENVKSENPIEDAALTQKKIEYNQWLFNKQNFYRNYQFFSLMSPEILYLEPIQ